MQLALSRTNAKTEATKNMSEGSSLANDRLRVSVITAHEPVANNRWITERWRVVGVVAARAETQLNGARTMIYSGADGTQYLWPGFELRLYPDESESYYRNLLGHRAFTSHAKSMRMANSFRLGPLRTTPKPALGARPGMRSRPLACRPKCIVGWKPSWFSTSSPRSRR